MISAFSALSALCTRSLLWCLVAAKPNDPHPIYEQFPRKKFASIYLCVSADSISVACEDFLHSAFIPLVVQCCVVGVRSRSDSRASDRGAPAGQQRQRQRRRRRSAAHPRCWCVHEVVRSLRSRATNCCPLARVVSGIAGVRAARVAQLVKASVSAVAMYFARCRYPWARRSQAELALWLPPGSHHRTRALPGPKPHTKLPTATHLAKRKRAEGPCVPLICAVSCAHCGCVH